MANEFSFHGWKLPVPPDVHKVLQNFRFSNFGKYVDYMKITNNEREPEMTNKLDPNHICRNYDIIRHKQKLKRISESSSQFVRDDS